MENPPEFEIRPLCAANFEDFATLVRALAEYEKLEPPGPDAVARLRKDGLGEKRRFEAFLGYRHGRAVAYALVFDAYSSFLGLPTLYLEDLYVLPGERKQGVGKRMFDHCVALAAKRGAGRMEWTALNWNEPAKRFYEKNGAVALDWTFFRLTREMMEDLVRRDKEEER